MCVSNCAAEESMVGGRPTRACVYTYAAVPAGAGMDAGIERTIECAHECFHAFLTNASTNALAHMRSRHIRACRAASTRARMHDYAYMALTCRDALRAGRQACVRARITGIIVGNVLARMLATGSTHPGPSGRHPARRRICAHEFRSHKRTHK